MRAAITHFSYWISETRAAAFFSASSSPYMHINIMRPYAYAFHRRLRSRARDRPSKRHD